MSLCPAGGGRFAHLFVLSVVAIVGLFSGFVVFPSLLPEGAAEPQGKSPVGGRGLRKREGGHRREERATGFYPWTKSRWCL